MTEKEKKALLREIAETVERAYRRGFQHGFFVSGSDGSGEKVTSDHVIEWRFFKNKKRSICPPGTKFAGDSWDITERLKMDCRVDGMIISLF